MVVSKEFYDGVRWVTFGSAPATTVPGSPTVLTVTPGSSQVAASCAAPLSNGGSAVTGYAWTCNPGSLIATTGPAVTSKLFTGLSASTSYTITVAAVNAVGTGAAASTTVTTTAASTIIYGPDGVNDWPPFTPVNARTSATVATTVSNNTALITALHTANAGDVIALTAGDYGDLLLNGNDASLLTRANGWAANNVIVRTRASDLAVGTQANFHGIDIGIPNITFAYIGLYDNTTGTRPGSTGPSSFLAEGDRNYIARSKGAPATQFTGVAGRWGPWGVWCPNPDPANPGGDRLHVGASQASNPPILNGGYNWLPSVYSAPGAHTDLVQWTTLTGAHSLTHTYLGPLVNMPGANNTFQMGKEQQGAYPLGDLVVSYCWLGGLSPGSAQSTGNGTGNPYNTTTFDHCVYQNQVTAPGGFPGSMTGCTMTNNVFEPADSSTPGLKAYLATAFPGSNSWGVAVTPPSFVQPNWWW